MTDERQRKSEEVSDRGLELLTAVREAVDEASNFDAWREAIAKLGRAGENIARMLLAFPGGEGVLDRAVPDHHMPHFKYIAEKGRALASAAQLEELSDELEKEMDRFQSQREREAVSQHRDSMIHVRSQSSIDLDNEVVQIRILGGRREDTVDVDFSKTPAALVNLAGVFISWVVITLDQIKGHAKNPANVLQRNDLRVAAEAAKRELDALIQELEELGEVQE